MSGDQNHTISVSLLLHFETQCYIWRIMRSKKLKLISHNWKLTFH
ncbi:hypothetical protein VDIAB_110030 [Vibrio diabolicus]|nr:hypothetical protein VDIAB_110030 [Vibrio diabolicus]